MRLVHWATTTVVAFSAYHHQHQHHHYPPAAARLWTTPNSNSCIRRWAAWTAVATSPRAATSNRQASCNDDSSSDSSAVDSNTVAHPQSPESWSATTTTTTTTPVVAIGRVVRVAAKAYSAQHSKPSSREYTTRKPNILLLQLGNEEDPSDTPTSNKHAATSAKEIAVTVQGLEGDYNHYRQTALNNTLDRAISILTTECYTLLQGHGYPNVVWGDLGENILVANVNYTFFRPHNRYRLEQANDDDDDDDGISRNSFVDLLITEAMEPCANLCTLPFINNPQLSRPDRVQSCQAMLQLLDQAPGLRGWYAAVVHPGLLLANANTIVRCLDDANADEA
jgi:hypothetical protein